MLQLITLVYVYPCRNKKQVFIAYSGTGAVTMGLIWY